MSKRNFDTREADDTLMDACAHHDNADEAFKAIADGANVNTIDENGFTPLMYVVCWKRENWEDAYLLVRELLLQGALVNITDLDGEFLLHKAIVNSSYDIVKMIVERCPFWKHLKGDNGYNALMTAVWNREYDDQSCLIASLFLEQIHTKCYEVGYSPLDLACTEGTPEMVELLLKNKADPNVENNNGHTPLYSAIDNQYAKDIVVLLLQAGADITKKDILSSVHATGDVDILDLMLSSRSVKGSFDSKLPSPNHPDYIGAVAVALKHEARTVMVGRDNFKRLSKKGDGYDRVAWAVARLAAHRFPNDLDSDFFRVIGECNSSHLWRYFANDFAGMIHPATGDTLLHVAVREKKTFAVVILMQRNVNPFWRNHSNHTAMDIAATNNDKEIISLLNGYACFRPTRIHARWYGPYFLMRAYTFLLVLKRIACIPKDVSNLILFFLGKLEYI